MHRIYVNEKINNSIISISDTAKLHYLEDVLRVKLNDEVILFDGYGNEYTCTIKEIGKERILLAVKETKHPEVRKTAITVACAIPKAAKMDDIIDGLTQVGVDSIIPMETERTVVRLDNTRKKTRLERWIKIARSSAQQSQRNTIPVVEPISSFDAVLSHSQEFDLKLLPTLAGERRKLKDLLADFSPTNILILIGPEGDFTPAEVELAKDAGFAPVSLGDTVLRVATAAIATVSFIRLSLE